MRPVVALVLCASLTACFPSIDREAWKHSDGQVEGDASLDDAPPPLPDADPGGCRWRAVTSPTDLDLRAVWGPAPNDVWAAGEEGALLHYDGTAWSKVSAPTDKDLSGVAGAGQDVWVVGDDGTVLRRSGGSWSSATTGSADLHGVWVGSSGVWAVGDLGTIRRNDGTGWSAESSTTLNFLYGIWGPAETELWAVGYLIRVRYDGTSWTKDSSLTASMWRDVHGLASGEIWAVGHCAGGKPKSCNSYVIRRTATGWSSQLSTGGKRLKKLWMREASDGWVVGEACCDNQNCSCGSVYRFDGTDWGGASLPKDTEPLNGVWGFAECDIWAVGEEGTILHRSDEPPGS